MPGQPDIIHARKPDCHPVFWPLLPLIEHSLDSQATWVTVFGLFCGILSMGVCTTRHWQTTGRLVQDLNVCTVGKNHDKTKAGKNWRQDNTMGERLIRMEYLE